MAEIDMTAPTVAPVVGEYAKDRRGVACGPIKWSPLNGRFSFTDGVNKSWDESGRYCGRGHHKFDLIAITPAPDSVEPDATQETGVVERATVVTFTEGGDEYQLTDDGPDGFDITTDHGGVLYTASMSRHAAVAIARAILRMAGDSK